MNKSNNILALIVFVVFIVLNGYFSILNLSNIWIWLPIMLGILILNIIGRRYLSFKAYFTSSFNFFVNKSYSEKEYDIPKALLYEKLIEVINDSEYKLVDSDSTKFELLALSDMSFLSWGENLYINFEALGEKTILKFCSTTLLGAVDWGKNEKNLNALIETIEDSLTV